MIDIGRVFRVSFAMFRQRFLLLAGMWLVFFAIQIAASIVLGLVVGIMGLAGSLALATDLAGPETMTGMGVGFAILLALFYGAYLAMLFAQQAALVTLASPLEQAAFGTALVRGVKSALPFLGLTVLLVLGYFGLSLGVMLVGGVAALGGGVAGGLLSALVALAFLPLLVYLMCRLAVVVAVVAVDQVYNPVSAIRRSWAVTRGKVIGVLLVLIGTAVLGALVLGLPIGLIIGAIISGDGSAGVVLAGFLLGLLVVLPLVVLFSLFFSAVTAALHSEVTAGGAERLEEVFA